MVLQLLPGFQGLLDFNRLSHGTQRRIHRVRDQMHGKRLALASQHQRATSVLNQILCAHLDPLGINLCRFWNFFKGSLQGGCLSIRYRSQIQHFDSNPGGNAGHCAGRHP